MFVCYGAGLLLSGACVVSVGYVNCNVYLAVVLIILGIGLVGLTTSITSGSNHLDLAPAFAGIFACFLRSQLGFYRFLFLSASRDIIVFATV